MNPILRAVLLLLSTVLVLFFVVGNLLGGSEPSPAYRELQLFTQSIKLIRSNYVEEVDGEALLRGARKGLVESLDPFSSFVEPDRARRLGEGDVRGDVGVELARGASGYARVIAVRPGSPADKAAVRSGRYLRAIDGVPTRDVSLLEARRALRGPVGSRVRLLFFEQGGTEPSADEGAEAAGAGEEEESEPDEDDPNAGLELLRSPAEETHVTADSPREGVRRLRLLDLRPGAAAELRAGVEKAAADGARSIVLDLRENPGGSLDEAAAAAAVFAPADTPVARLRRQEGKPETIVTRTAPVWRGGLAVVIGPSTIGEAEALAAALRDGAKAPLVGERTFGKGLRQERLALADGSLLELSTSVIETGRGDEIQKEGVRPTAEVQRGGEAVVRREASPNAPEVTPLGRGGEAMHEPATPDADWEMLLLDRSLREVEKGRGGADGPRE